MNLRKWLTMSYGMICVCGIEGTSAKSRRAYDEYMNALMVTHKNE